MRLSFFQSFDHVTFLVTLFLTAFGMLTLYSISLSTPEVGGGEIFRKQLIFALVGFTLYFVLSRLHYHILGHISLYLYVLSLILLVVTFIWGLETRGSTRWIDLAGIRIQPSEFLKLTLIISLASHFSRNSAKGLKNLLRPLILTLAPIVLIFKQPDLGSTVVLFGILTSLMIASGLRGRHFLIFTALVSMLIPLSWGLLKDYQKERVLTFLNPSADPLGKGYNVIQSIIAVGSGQITGKGFGRGTQSHLHFLPEQHTDFIFATLAEELGLIGVSIFFSLVALLIFRLLNISSRTQDPFGSLLVLGIAVQILSQFAISVGMNLGVLPVTGITLPLVSYGGSSLITILASLGIIQSIVRFGGFEKQT